MRPGVNFSILVIFFFLLTGCGTTRIVVDQNVNADIYLNGVKKAQNYLEITRTGTPKRIELSAKYQGQELGKISVRRKFEWTTFLVGYFTYGIGFLTAWRFPEQIVIPVKRIDMDIASNPWDTPRKSIWMKPLNKIHN